MIIIEEITDFANQNPVCFLATVEKDSPRVRGLLLWFADDTGFYFYTDESKDLYRQLKANPRIEICFYRQGKTFFDTKMLRISGKVEIIDNQAVINRLQEQRGYLRKLSGSLVVFRICRGKAILWSGSDAVKNTKPVPFRCGGALKQKGVQHDACLTVLSGEKYHHLKYETIAFLASHGKQTVIHSRSGDFAVPEMLKHVENKLPGDVFIRIHKQYVVNRNFIMHLDHESGGRYSVFLTDDDDSVLPVGRTYARTLRMALGSGTFIP